MNEAQRSTEKYDAVLVQMSRSGVREAVILVVTKSRLGVIHVMS